MTAIVDDVRSTFSLSLSPDYGERCLQAKPNLTPSELYQKALKEHLRDICGTTLLPYGIAAQVNATLPSAVVLQINNSRDATQPLRPCADVTDEEALLNAAMQRNSDKRLLRLLLTDGNSEIPALELSTLRVFHGIPLPGEKVLIHQGAEVRNGCIILSEDNITLLGGEVYQLKQDFLAHRRRLEAGYTTSNGLNGAPRFEPLQVGQHYGGNQGFGAAQHASDRQGSAPPQWTNSSNNSHSGRGRGGGGYNHDNNHWGGRGGGRGRGGDGYGGHDRGRGGGGGGGRGGRGGRGYGGGGGGSDGGRGRGRGGGGGYRGRGGAPPYHADASNMQPREEKFPTINEANFPRLS